MATEKELRSKVADWLVQYLGIKEGSTGHKEILAVFNNSGLCSRYKMTVNDAWCATAVSAAFIACGLSDIFPCVECSCNNMVTLAKKAGIWVENDAYTPSVGDVILYDWQDSGSGDNTGTPDHVGIVYSISGSSMKIIEGNKSDTVAYRSMTVNGKYIRGYITPKYADAAASSSTKAAATAAADPEATWNYLMNEIGNAYGVAGLMGNLYAESALLPINLQNTGNTKLGMTDAEYTAAVDDGSYTNFVKDSQGYGLAQWTYYTRKQALLDYAEEQNASIGNLNMQLGFLVKELTESYKTVLSTLKSATSVKGASDAVLTKYEKPANQSSSVKTKRASYGQTYYDKYAGTSTATDTGSTLTFAVGDAVTFSGTKHYSSENATSASTCKGGTAKVTAVSKGSKHPYHLIHTGTGCTVYGWVDEADVSEVASSTSSTSADKSKTLQGADEKDDSLAGTYKTTVSLNLRYGPSADDYAVVVAMPKGTSVKCYGYYSLNGSTKWLYAVATVSGKQYRGFCSMKYLTATTTTTTTATTTTTSKSPLKLAAENVEAVYKSCIGCRHVSGSYTWTKAMEEKKVNCSIPATRVAVLAGLLADGKRISHTSAVSSNILSKKNTIAKVVSGYGNLDTTKCSITWVGKKYSALPSKYKVAGAIYIYDSNIAVCGGNGIIYACHNWAKQMTAGKGTYTDVALTSGYCFSSEVLVVILPNS